MLWEIESLGMWNLCVSPFGGKNSIFTTKTFYLGQMQEQLNGLCDIVRIFYDKNEVLIQGDFNLD